MQKSKVNFVVVEVQSNDKYGIKPTEKELDCFDNGQQAIELIAEKAQDFISNVIGNKAYMWNFDKVGGTSFNASNKETGHTVRYYIDAVE